MHWAWAVAQTPFDAAARQSFTRAGAASHLASPSRLQVARQSYILEVSHIHLCDWRRSLDHPSVLIVATRLRAVRAAITVIAMGGWLLRSIVLR